MIVLPLPPFSYIQEQGDGTKTSYTLTFPFIERAHVHVSKGTTDIAEGTGLMSFSGKTTPRSSSILRHLPLIWSQSDVRPRLMIRSLIGQMAAI